MSLEYDYPNDTPTREELEQADADRDPPECICERRQAGLYNPDCYWHGTEADDRQRILMSEPLEAERDALRAQLEETKADHAAKLYTIGGEVVALRARCEQLQTILAYEGTAAIDQIRCRDANSWLAGKLEPMKARCEQLEAALREIVQASKGVPDSFGCDRYGDCNLNDCHCSNHLARAAMAQESTIAVKPKS